MALGGACTNALNALHHAARALGGLSAPTVVVVPSEAIDPSTGELRDGAVWASGESTVATRAAVA